MPPPPDPVPSRASKILFGKYQLGRLLGCGGTAKVYHARNLLTNQSVAIKCITKSRAAKGSPCAIEREVSIMRRLHHPHILRLLEVLASLTKIYFVLELAKGGELFARLAARGRLSEDPARRIFHQLISAVSYCHSHNVFHRDLKPENLLLDEAGDLKVSDFGLSAQLPSPDSASGDGKGRGLLHTLCGTPAYVAPEILAKKGYSGAAVDVWSCGVILFVITAGYLPFNDTNLMAMYRKIYRGEFRFPKWISPELRRLISRLLDNNPETRITVEEIVRDPWFREGLDEEKWTAMMRFSYNDGKIDDKEERDLNAFDIISFSSGLDLSGLVGSGVDRERFVWAGAVEEVLVRVEEVGEDEEGVAVRRNGGKVVVEERWTGNVVAGVEVNRLREGMVVVEMVGEEAWREKIRCAFRGTGVGDLELPVAQDGTG